MNEVKHAGRPPTSDERRKNVNMTLPAQEVEELRKIGYGSASLGVSILLKWSRENVQHAKKQLK
jgi:hypothetical protein